uniref:Uncharacterized protein n=1 Tax=Astatotilapia calliptera TaxID=8154 RepID=A0A3P8RBW8_ASTCA
VYFPCHSFSLPFPLFIFHSLILQAELNTRHPPPLTCRNFEHLLMCGFHFNTRTLFNFLLSSHSGVTLLLHFGQ